MRTITVTLLASVATLVACGAARGPAAAIDPPPVASLATAPATTPMVPWAPVVVSASASAAALVPAFVTPLVVGFHRELEAGVTALVLERSPFAAAMTNEGVWMHEARGWHFEPLQAGVRGLPFALFYGRDDRVRLVRRRSDDASAKGTYLRWKPDGFREAPYELGKLAAMPHPLVSVLGNEDPEIVCQPGDTCVVKRRTGWRFIDAPADIARVTLGEGVGWAIAGAQLLRLGEAWERVGSPGEWRSADAMFATRDRVWVVETAAGRVHAFDGTTWRALASPVERPHALWGASRDALWLAGDGGLAFFDGHAWRPVVDAPAPFRVVAGRSADDVWVGGGRGLYRIERR